MDKSLLTLLQESNKDSLIDFLMQEAGKDASLARRLHIAFGEETISPNVDVIRNLFELCGWRQQKHRINGSHVLFCMILFFGHIVG